jgi:2-phospho-L-lactate guanylyltransferase
VRRVFAATVRTWSPADGAGTALRDDGSEVEFPPDAFAASGLRRLRPGQRVRVETENAQVVLVTVVTMPGPQPP